jgi:hypothetical protein
VPVRRLDQPLQPGLDAGVGLGQGPDLDVEPGHLPLQPRRLGPAAASEVGPVSTFANPILTGGTAYP